MRINEPLNLEDPLTKNLTRGGGGNQWIYHFHIEVYNGQNDN